MEWKSLKEIMMMYVVLAALFATGFSSIVGEWTVVDRNSKSVQRIAAISMSNQNVEIVNICEAKTQLVAGMNYKITMTVKDKGSTGTSRYCTIRAYEVVWLHKLDIEEFSCDKMQKSCPEKKQK